MTYRDFDDWCEAAEALGYSLRTVRDSYITYAEKEGTRVGMFDHDRFIGDLL
jgi:hypothetical protein